MNTVWFAQEALTRPLEKDLTVDTAIVGAGITGILTGYLLKEKGIPAIIVDSEDLCAGVTCGTTAKITAQHRFIYSTLTHSISSKAALQYALAQRAAIEKYREIIVKNKIDCEFETKSSYLYSLDDLKSLEREREAARRAGILCMLEKETALPFPVAGALRLDGQAQVHPLKLLHRLALELPVYSHAQVKRVDLERRILYTSDHTIRAKRIIFASHYPFINTPGWYFWRMYQERSYVIALENAADLGGMYMDALEQGYTFRNYQDLLLVGGSSHRTGVNEADQFGKLRRFARMTFPQSQERYHWSTQDCMTLDCIPYIGQFSMRTPNVYIATGFNKWGMSNAMVAAMLLSDSIIGKPNKSAALFSPQRFYARASAIRLAQHGVEMAKGFAAKCSVPKLELNDLARGEGAILFYHDKKVGAYKEQDGRVYLVSTVCPHMGCQLVWNQADLSWDCPCHGSRFDYRGCLLNDPAQQGLECSTFYPDDQAADFHE